MAEPKRKISELLTLSEIPAGSFMIIETPTGTKKVSTDNLCFMTADGGVSTNALENENE